MHCRLFSLEGRNDFSTRDAQIVSTSSQIVKEHRATRNWGYNRTVRDAVRKHETTVIRLHTAIVYRSILWKIIPFSKILLASLLVVHTHAYTHTHTHPYHLWRARARHFVLMKFLAVDSRTSTLDRSLKHFAANFAHQCTTC